MTDRITVLPGEVWWGGAVADGHEMPFRPGFRRDLMDDTKNQAMPLLVSSRGRYLWSEEAFAFELTDGDLVVDASKYVLGQGGDDLADAYRAASTAHFPPSGSMPEARLFAQPQYALWIELLYEPTQEKVIGYAEEALANGFPPGILVIDEQWHGDYGDWVFHPVRFPDPVAMIDRLHALGFGVSLWVAPFVTPDSRVFRELYRRRLLLTDESGEALVGRWWNGYSAALDLLNPETRAWLDGRLSELLALGADGFKFDGGDLFFYEGLGIPKPLDHVAAWNSVGQSYPLNEFRAAWRAAGLPLAQRQRDKHHSWDREFGIASLIPHGIAQSLTGHAFHCPDMIGGGDYLEFPHTNAGAILDGELFVRWAQCAALFPMMQFSAAPWRVLSDETLIGICRSAAMLHVEHGQEILRLAEVASQTGRPILRPLALEFPDGGYEDVDDEFMLGSDLLVAPVLGAGLRTRRVTLPPGRWCADDGGTWDGPDVVDVDAPLDRLPRFRRQRW